MASDILLEAGTNELELLVFRLDGTPFGINVAKVRDILQRVETIDIPNSPDAVEGSFQLRDRVLTLVNLGKYFNMVGEAVQQGGGQIVTVEFNKMTCGILVDSVDEIQRLKWDDIEPPSPFLMGLGAPITGVAHVGNEIVLVADFETIVSEILGVHIDDVPREPDAETVARDDVRILLADDSSILRKQLVRILTQSGFTNLVQCADGQEAWDTLEARRGDNGLPFDLVLTDIEMPRMDGLHLTSRIKGDAVLRDMPVVLFSSLINEDNKRKGNQVGADAQVSKPDSQELIEAVEACLAKKGLELDGAATPIE